jgi:hypothetical protein
MKKGMILALLAVMLSSFAAASFSVGNQSSDIQSTYSPGEILKGWINISLHNEPVDSLLESGIGNVKLIDLISSANPDEYTCIPSGCTSNYEPIDQDTSKSFSLNYGGEKVVAFVVNGIIDGISGLSFSFSSNNQRSCLNPLRIDLLDDGVMDWKASVFTEDYSCTANGGSGCFNSSTALTDVYIGSTPFCEKIRLTESGKFKLGALVRKDDSSSNPSDELKMTLNDLDGNQVENGECILPEPGSSYGEISCNIDYYNSGLQDYFVCLSSGSNAITKYEIQREDVNPCGCSSNPPCSNFNYDYNLFARGAKFESIGKVNFNQQAYDSGGDNTLAQYVSDYISSEYGNNCSAGCVIPVKFKSYSPSLNIILSNLSLSYNSGGGISTNKIYDVNMNAGKINSNFMIINLDSANFSLPQDYGNFSLSLLLGGNQILTKNVYVAQVPTVKSVFPTAISAAVPTKFSANIISPLNKSIVRYSWDFGDGNNEDTTTNFVTHAYSAIGQYILILTIEDEDGQSSYKETNIMVGNPREIANSTIKKYRQRIDNVTSQVESYPTWYRKIIENGTGILELNDQLKVFERKYSTSSSDDEFIEVMSGLVEMRVPTSVGTSSRGRIPLSVSADNVNLEALGQLGAGTFDPEKAGEYQDAIERWANAQLTMNADFQTISVYYDNENVPMANYYKLNIEPAEANTMAENYFVINSPSVINSEIAEEVGNDSGIYGIKFDSLESREIEFVIPGDMSALNAPIAMSPSFNSLELSETVVCNNNEKCEEGENWGNCRNDCKPWGWTVILIVVLIFVAFGSYLIIQEWYKRKYEGYLFKNKNDLFNLVNFISNALSKGMGKGDIEKRLKQYGWSSEQVVYAFKKVKGYRTGLPFEFKFPIKPKKK